MITLVQFPRIQLTWEVEASIKSKFTEKMQQEAYDFFDRVNEYGLNREALGTRVYTYKNGVSKVRLSEKSNWVFTIKKEHGIFIIVDLYKVHLSLA